jgi:hypothetical protein
MINRTDAWKCSDGSCHPNRQTAYTAEINYLYRDIPKVGNRQPTAMQFGKFVKEVAEWLNKAEQTQRQMKDESDVETRRSIDGQGG